MGVMLCNRGDCENILCDRYSCEYGYICTKCFEELVREGVRTNVGKFMASNVPDNQQAGGDVALLHFKGIFQL